MVARCELRSLVRLSEAHEPTAALFDATARARFLDCLDTALALVDGDVTRIDSADTSPDPATLLTITLLARAGRAAMEGRIEDLCCGVNPLHGPGPPATTYASPLQPEQKAPPDACWESAPPARTRPSQSPARFRRCCCGCRGARRRTTTRRGHWPLRHEGSLG
ncbi:hypothetical protein [Streptomyces sp. NPDC002328]|uniref:hypothetical protein n=1 Tax=Streptomyces sp. NPDC002328 TaxID=3364642 RepID=UPI00369DB6A5